LQTGCTVTVSNGMVVRTNTRAVSDARDDIIEFLLTSHPLDCPICDKGGECPLQNLTMRYGPGTTRFSFEDKLRQAKNVPLGDLIFLDRERCIQCARCTRFQDEIADDPVIAFHNRGKHLEIVTMSEPGFDSYWSGNTTDICPVGALTTADFRFGARPWEMTPVATLCSHCPVGCNMTISTRKEAKSGGRSVVKRIMPRQNEQVNEIWICDKGRFLHHYAASDQRLSKPLIRQDGKLEESSWEAALDLVAGRLQIAKEAVAGLASDRLSNEDLFMFQKFFRHGLGSNNLDLANKRLAGGDVVANVGIASGSNLSKLGTGDAILVVASDLHDEAPIWWLRVKQAAERGAALVVMNLRTTRLDKFASDVIRYKPGQTLSSVYQLLNATKVDIETTGDDPVQLAANTLIEASNLVIFYGSEGLTYGETDVLARMLGNLTLVRQMDGEGQGYHAGQTNSGLIPVWSHGNTQGAWDMGLQPDLAPGYIALDKPGFDAEAILQKANSGDLKALFLIGSDPIGDGLMSDRDNLDFLVVQDLFLTESAKLANVVLPALSWVEREGTYTNGERRVQRFYQALSPMGEGRPDWQILAQLSERVGLGKPPFAASLVFREIAAHVPQYAGMDYRSLAYSEAQWPVVGGEDLYYGGNAYENESGLGQQWPVTAESGLVDRFELPDIRDQQPDGLVIVPTAALYAAGTLIAHSHVLASRLAAKSLSLNWEDAQSLEVKDGDMLSLKINGSNAGVQIVVDNQTPLAVALLSGMGHDHRADIKF